MDGRLFRHKESIKMMHWRDGRGKESLHAPYIVLMSSTGLSLGRLLASRADLRFRR